MPYFHAFGKHKTHFAGIPRVEFPGNAFYAWKNMYETELYAIILSHENTAHFHCGVNARRR
ncbi:MAG: hypothetical protein IJK04_12770, partial [Kiritimatiellae bacterium]|nr:hypothetical protein [Kiritimatiellia bacterium]